MWMNIRAYAHGHAQFPHTVASIVCVYARFDVRERERRNKVSKSCVWIWEQPYIQWHHCATECFPQSKWEEEIYVLYSSCLKSCEENEAHTINNFISSCTYTLIANWRQEADHWRLQAHSHRHTHAVQVKCFECSETIMSYTIPKFALISITQYKYRERAGE